MRTVAANGVIIGGGASFRPSLSGFTRRRSKVLRFLGRLAHGVVLVGALPRWTASLGAVLFLFGFALYGILLSGTGLEVLDTATRDLGLSIQTVEISGQSQTSEADIMDLLGVKPGVSLLAYDLSAARKRLLADPWVQDVTLRKFYPGELKVAVTERAPFALWQPTSGDPVYIIEKDGQVIVPYKAGRFAGLPLVLGVGADQRVDEVLGIIRAVPSVAGRVKASILVSERRWDLVLDNGLRIMLPEDDPAAALARVADLDKQSQLFSRDITVVDVRLPDRVVLRLSDDALKQREQMIAARMKAAKGAQK